MIAGWTSASLCICKLGARSLRWALSAATVEPCSPRAATTDRWWCKSRSTPKAMQCAMPSLCIRRRVLPGETNSRFQSPRAPVQTSHLPRRAQPRRTAQRARGANSMSVLTPVNTRAWSGCRRKRLCLIAHARKNPATLHYGSSGVGTSLHLAGALLESMTGAKLVHLPFKGVDQATVATIGGESQIIIHNSAPMLPHVKAGRVRGIAVTTAKRLPSFPDLPTVSEAGVSGYEIVAWGGFMAPRGLPKEILARLNTEFNIAMKAKNIQDTYNAAGVLAIGGSAQQFTDYLRSETQKWGTLIKSLGIKAQQ